MNPEVDRSHRLVTTQKQWNHVLSGSDVAVRRPKITITEHQLHRRLYRATFPDRPVRCEFQESENPRYTGLVGESVTKIFEHLTAVQERNRALVIGASGANFLLALFANYHEVIVIDENPAQIGWLYTVLVFILLTEKQHLHPMVEAFRNSQYALDDYHSIQLSEIRSRYLQGIPDACSWLEVPYVYRSMVQQNIEYCALLVLRELLQSNIDFASGYPAIRQSLLEKRMPDIILGDLFSHVATNPGTYNAIVTSNVFEWCARRLSLSDFCQQMTVGLKSGGVTNAHNIMGLDTNGLTGDFSIVRFEPCKPNEWVNNWLLIQKN